MVGGKSFAFPVDILDIFFIGVQFTHEILTGTVLALGSFPVRDNLPSSCVLSRADRQALDIAMSAFVAFLVPTGKLQ